MTRERQNELITINKVLAVLTVFLALIAGYLFADKQAWLKKKNQPVTVGAPAARAVTDTTIKLPAPQTTAAATVSQALANLEDKHTFIPEQIGVNQLSELLWAAQGQVTSWGQRTATSYKSVYPVNVTVVLHQPVNEDILSGIYLYQAEEHALQLISEKISELDEEENIESLQTAPINLILSADANHYLSEVGQEYVNLVYAEAGAIQQNIQLQSAALNLGTTTLYRLNQESYKHYFQIPQNETIIMGMPIGVPVHQ